ncbi:oxidoreductase [Acuticoccus sediminis]|uniref:Oxidoreductase n=1 Tax=Acuticoccus sediminis TaxID=2184697 RepID=A0A8B2NMG3_9HYPH|nr:PDR/VanB family oxidoreductase [Acuticoccus sediminis]RAH98994.1 oxidoreductase [Acuticoccus sediminis]
MARHIETVVRRIEALTPTVRLIELADPDDWPLPPFRAGAHVDLHLPNGLTRSYSLCGDPQAATRWRLAVLREVESRGGSAHLHDALAVGDTVACSLPRNNFPLAADGRRHVFLAAGIGVTPFLAMVADLERSGAHFHLHLWARAADMAPFAADVARLAGEGRASLHLPGPERLSIAAAVAAEAADEGAHLYACGPARFLDDYDAATAALDPARVHREYFVPPPVEIEPDAGPFEVELARSGMVLTVEPGQTVLAAVRAAGVAVDASCEGGICGACRTRVLSGEPRHADRVLKPSERAEAMMICVGGSRSPRLTLDL